MCDFLVVAKVTVLPPKPGGMDKGGSGEGGEGTQMGREQGYRWPNAQGYQRLEEQYRTEPVTNAGKSEESPVEGGGRQVLTDCHAEAVHTEEHCPQPSRDRIALVVDWVKRVCSRSCFGVLFTVHLAAPTHLHRPLLQASTAVFTAFCGRFRALLRDKMDDRKAKAERLYLEGPLDPLETAVRRHLETQGLTLGGYVMCNTDRAQAHGESLYQTMMQGVVLRVIHRQPLGRLAPGAVGGGGGG